MSASPFRSEDIWRGKHQLIQELTQHRRAPRRVSDQNRTKGINLLAAVGPWVHTALHFT